MVFCNPPIFPDGMRFFLPFPFPLPLPLPLSHLFFKLKIKIFQSIVSKMMNSRKKLAVPFIGKDVPSEVLFLFLFFLPLSPSLFFQFLFSLFLSCTLFSLSFSFSVFVSHLFFFQASEFAHPEVLIGLTVLAYRYEVGVYDIQKKNKRGRISCTSLQFLFFFIRA